MAGTVRILAGLVPGHQFQNPQWQARLIPGVGTERRQGIQRQPPPRCLHGQKGQPVDVATWHGLQGGVQRAQGLADTGGRLDQQATAARRRPVDILGEPALPGPKVVVGKGETSECRVTPRAMLRLALRPRPEAPAQCRQEAEKLAGLGVSGQHRFSAGDNIQVDQRQGHPCQPLGLAQQGTIDRDLRPMQGALIVPHAGQITTVGLDLLDSPKVRVEAVGTPSDDQALQASRDSHLGPIARRPAATTRACPSMPSRALGAGVNR